MYKKILVPLDGSRIAEEVLPHAKALAYSEGAELILLNVAANPGDYILSDPGLGDRAISEQEEKSKQYMAAVESKLVADGFRVSVLLRHGATAETILQIAEDLRVDAIAMATHARTGAARWLLGSVAERVVRNSNVPVLLIRARNQEPAQTSGVE
jgi:nucleotide-binding universal stress UspA family protein